jgi:hypothetical protein
MKVDFDYVLITLVVTVLVIVTFLNNYGRTIVFDGKVPDQKFGTPITPRIWMVGLPSSAPIQLPLGSSTEMANPDWIFPNPSYNGQPVTINENALLQDAHEFDGLWRPASVPQIGTGLPTTTQPQTCYKFITDTYCQ